MDDVFWYNSGSLLQALNPAQTMVDLTGDPVMQNVDESFLPSVTVDGKVYGVPQGTAMGGGILYNKDVYSKLGLQIPMTWADFEANNAKIKTAGITPVIETFKAPDTWTSQLFVLADYYNVQLANPSFAKDYTANKAKYATDPAAVKGFQKLAEVQSKGYVNSNYGSASLAQGVKLLGTGKGAQYPMLTFVVGTMPKDQQQKIGFFGIPGDDASKAGATIWEPGAAYISKTSKNQALAKKFLAFMASPAGTDAYSQGSAADRPVPDQGIHAAGRRPARGGRHPEVHRLQERLARTGVPLAGEGPVPGADHRRRRHRPDLAAAGRGPVRRRRDEGSQAVGTAGMVTESRPSSTGSAGLRVAAEPGRAGRPGRRRQARSTGRGNSMVARTYSHWFYVPAGVIYLVIFVVPTVMSFWFALTRWTLFDAQFDRPRQLPPVLLRAGTAQRPLAHGRVRALVTSGLKVVLGMLFAVAPHLEHPHPRAAPLPGLLPGARQHGRRRDHLRRPARTRHRRRRHRPAWVGLGGPGLARIDRPPRCCRSPSSTSGRASGWRR